MNNDLISREALKKAFEKVYPLSTNEMGGVVNKRVYDIIDNAPTVEGPKYILKTKTKTLTAEDKKRFQEEWNKSAGGLLAVPDDYEIIPIEKPKGEWKPFVYDYDIGGDHTRPPREGEGTHWEEYWAEEYKCSICGAKNHKTDFCPWCGADMRKEGQP